MQYGMEFPIREENILLRLGGKYNPRAMTVVFPVCGNDVEIQKCCDVVSAINLIDFRLNNLNPEVVKNVSLYMRDLVHLNCISSEVKNMIKTKIHHFLQYMLDDLSYHHLNSKQLRHEATFRQNYDWMEQFLRDLNGYLIKYEIISRDSPLTLSKSINCDLLPQKLSAFIVSIDDTDDCKTTWEGYLHTINSVALSNYFHMLAQNIRRILEEDHEHALYAIDKLGRFVGSLSRRTSHFNLERMKDAIRAIHAHRIIDFTDELSSLKKQFNILYYESGKNFDGQFSIFKVMLSQALDARQRQPEGMQEILTTLQLYIHKRKVSKPHQQTIRDYIYTCIGRLTEPLPEHVATRFATLQSKYQNARNQSREAQKLNVLNCLIKICREYPEKNYLECYKRFKEEASQKIKTLLAEHRGSMFCRHRFKDTLRVFEQIEDIHPSLHVGSR